jgi:hypothetical protein
MKTQPINEHIILQRYRLHRVDAIHAQEQLAVILFCYQEKEFINLDKYLKQIFECDRIRFSEIPNKLQMFCLPPDPIVINHFIKYEYITFNKLTIVFSARCLFYY